MALQTFPLETLQKVRRYICAQLALPPSEQHPITEEDGSTSATVPDSLDALGNLFRVGGVTDEAAPAPNTGGQWFLSTIDPAAAVNKLPDLSLKPGIRLVTYLQRRPGSGMGVTWALPTLMSTTTQLESALETAGSGSIPPHPRGTLNHVMDSIEGKRTPASFVAASLLLREWKELGRVGPNRRWSQHRLVAAVPSQQHWQWRTSMPKDLTPKVKAQEKQPVWVEFFSCRVTAPIVLFRHLDQYDARSYRPKTQDQVIATLETAKTNAASVRKK